MEALSLGSEGVIRFDLTRGFVALVDADRFESTLAYNCRDGRTALLRPSSIRWFAQRNRNYFYAYADAPIEGWETLIALHRLLIEAPAQLLVDHVNGDTMDNRMRNLRICTASENARNCRKYSRGTSRFKGVRFRDGRWVAQWHWRDNGVAKCRSLGAFESEIEAARAYDRAAIEHFGEFARLNFPIEATPATSS